MQERHSTSTCILFNATFGAGVGCLNHLFDLSKSDMVHHLHYVGELLEVDMMFNPVDIFGFPFCSD